MLRPCAWQLVAVVLTGWAWCCWAEDQSKVAYTDPAQAGVDFQIQGEYLGQIETDSGLQPYGAQVIALGGGKFDAVGFPGGLPGAGWKRGDETVHVEGQLTDGAAVFHVEGATVKVCDGALTVESEGRKLGTLRKTERKSPTLGAKPPAGAVVLFDGTSVGDFESAKLVEGNLLGATDCYTKQTFGDHQLHVEFRTPFMPNARGQGRGNSGVYVQSRFEVQVLDSFGLEGKDNECGGIYAIAQPAVNMCFPPLAWQTYDVDFTAARYNDKGEKVKNARITVRHNGVVIHDNLELTRGTPGRLPEGPNPAGVYLQNHGNPVAFRNIWAVKK